MKKLFLLNEEEKERILNMHRDATKKQYLIENKQELLNEGRVPQFLSSLADNIGILLKRGARGVKGAFYVDRAKVVDKIIKTLNKHNLVDSNGVIYYISEVKPTPIAGVQNFIIKEYDYKNFLDNGINDLIKSGEFDALKLFEIDALNQKRILEPNVFNRAAKIANPNGEGSIIAYTNGKFLDTSNVTFEGKIFDSSSNPFSKINLNAIRTTKSAKTNVKYTRWGTGALSTVFIIWNALYFEIFDFLGWFTSGAQAASYKEVNKKFCKETTEPPSASVDETNLNKFYNELLKVVSPKNKIIKLNEIKSFEFLHALGYKYFTEKEKCILRYLEKSMDNAQRLTVYEIINNLKKSSSNISTVEVTTEKKKEKVKEALDKIGNAKPTYYILDGLQNKTLKEMKDATVTTSRGETVDIGVDFNLWKERILGNCPCKLYKYFMEYRNDNKTGIEYVVLNPGEGNFYAAREILILSADKTKMIGSNCTEINASDLYNKLSELIKYRDAKFNKTLTTEQDENFSTVIEPYFLDIAKNIRTQGSDECN